MTPTPMHHMLEAIKPYARAVKYGMLYRRSLREARRTRRLRRATGRAGDTTTPIAFLLGCGRSGTTILGDLMADHPQVHYLFEPYHKWAAIDPRTDLLRLYVEGQGETLMRGDEVDDDLRAQFHGVIREEANRPDCDVLVEKTPINTLRIGYLEALAPTARYLHIVRDGADVCRSIDRLATENAYSIAGKPALNRWWGVGGYKWRALARDGAKAGYYPDEVGALTTNLECGAYEWLISLHEVDRHRSNLGGRLLEFAYECLTHAPRRMLNDIASHLGIDADESWLRAAGRSVDHARRNAGEPLRLPPKMAADFNRFQERYGFANRAEARN